MLLLIPVSAFVVAAIVEMLRLAYGVPREASLKGAYPVAAFWIVGVAAALTGQPFSIYSSMYFLAFVSAFLGPMFATLVYAYREKCNKR